MTTFREECCSTFQQENDPNRRFAIIPLHPNSKPHPPQLTFPKSHPRLNDVLSAAKNANRTERVGGNIRIKNKKTLHHSIGKRPHVPFISDAVTRWRQGDGLGKETLAGIGIDRDRLAGTGNWPSFPLQRSSKRSGFFLKSRLNARKR